MVVSSRKQEACDAAEAINERHGAGKALAIAASISSKEAQHSLVERTVTGFGQVDVLVCNAASNPFHDSWAGISDE